MFNVLVTIYNSGDKPIWVRMGKGLSPFCIAPRTFFESTGGASMVRLYKRRPPTRRRKP